MKEIKKINAKTLKAAKRACFLNPQKTDKNCTNENKEKSHNFNNKIYSLNRLYKNTNVNGKNYARFKSSTKESTTQFDVNKNYIKSEAGIVKNTILFPVLILIAICLLSIGYAATNVSLDITGTVSADKQEGIVITNVTESTSTEASGEIGYYIGYEKYALLNSTVTLSSSSSSSSITYTIEIINTNDVSYYFDSVNIGDSSAYYTNDDIEYEISLTEGDEITAGGTLTFTLTFSYADGITPSSSNNTLTSYIQFVFTDEAPATLIDWQYVDGSEYTQVTNGIVVLTVGDVVNYDATATDDGEAVTYTSPTGSTSSITSGNTTQGSGYTSTQSFSNQSYTGTWSVLGVNETTHEILLISTDVVQTTGNANYRLSGMTGYEWGETELDNICEIFGKGEYATGARSVTVDDINKLTGYNPLNVGVRDPDQTVTDGTRYGGTSSLSSYLNEMTYTKNVSTEYIDYQGSIYPTSLTTQTSFSTFRYYNGSTWITLASGEDATVTSTYYYYYPCSLTTSETTATTGLTYGEQPYTLLFGNSSSYKSYWLGSSYVITETGYAYFGMRGVYSRPRWQLYLVQLVR